METEELILLIFSICITLVSTAIIFSAIFIARKAIQYYNQKSILDYKVYMTSMGLKKYVDDTLDEYITDSMEECLTTNPKFIDKNYVNSDDEKELLSIILTQVIMYIPESFKEQMRNVYNIDRIVDEDGTTGFTDLVTRRVYNKILTLTVAANTVKDQGQVPLYNLMEEENK